MISADDILPYDRTLLSKILPTADVNKLLIRSQDFLDKADIEFKLGLKAEKIDPRK